MSILSGVEKQSVTGVEEQGGTAGEQQSVAAGEKQDGAEGDLDADEPRGLISPWERFGLAGRALGIANWLSVVAAVYLLITAVSIIGSGFQLATGDQAEALFSFATNPLVGLMVGIVATALIQSSTTTTSVTVGLVAGGLPLSVAVPILLGANIGTTLTNSLVSLGMVKEKEAFRRSFAAATVHDFYNLIAVAIFLPLEMMFGLLERVASAVAGFTAGADGGPVAAVFEAAGAVVTGVTSPLASAVEFSLGWLPDVWQGVAMSVIGLGLILLVISFIGRMLKILLVGRAKQVLHTAIGRGPLAGIVSGAAITVMVQSSTTTTSLVVPLAGSGAFTLRQVYPFTLGANVGTTLTALVAAFAFDGYAGQIALTAALVHVLFNLMSISLIFGLPFLRDLAPRGATWLANLAAEKKIYAAVWVLGVFLALPLTLILITSIF